MVINGDFAPVVTIKPRPAPASRTASGLTLKVGTLDPLTIKSRQQMAEIAVRLTQAGAGFYAPMIRAAMAGDLRFAIVPPSGQIPLRLLEEDVADRRPLVVILSADGNDAAGPDAFPQARRMLRWARALMIHAAGGQPEHYAAAVCASIALRRFLLVETDTAHEAEWCALAARLAPHTPMLRITTRPGTPPHPSILPQPGETVQ